MNFKKQIILRADANYLIGHGHVYRLLALIENLGPEYYFHFCTYTQDEFLLQLISSKANKTTILKRTIESNNKVKFDLENVIKENDAVILDGYGFSNEYHEKIRKTGSKLIIIDDLVSPDIMADVIINHAPGVRKEDYYNCRASKFYLGLNYALLRKEFYSLVQKQRMSHDLSKVFICFGGGNHPQVVEKVIDALLSIVSVEEINIIGNLDYKLSHNKKVIKHQYLNPTQMSSLMWKCGVSICPSSTIALESAFADMRIITGLTAENQRYIYRGLSKMKNVHTLGSWDTISFDVVQLELEKALKKFANLTDFPPIQIQNKLKKIKL